MKPPDSAAQAALTSRLAAALPQSLAGEERRRAALAAFAALGLPSHREENWRYADLHALQEATLSPAAPGKSDIDAGTLPPAIGGYLRYTFVDGHLAPELSSAQAAQAGAASDAAHSAPAIAFFDAAPGHAPAPQQPDTRLALLNDALATDSARIVAADTARPTCVEVIFVASAPATRGASYPRLEVHAHPGTRLGLIERHISFDNTASFINCAVTVRIDPGATVDHYRLQQTGAQATWMDTLTAKVRSNAAYRLHLAHLGGAAARSTLHIELQGQGATVTLNAVSVTARPQVQDVLATIEHAAPGTRTEQRFRGIAAEQARVAFNGKVIVRAAARGAVSRQSLRSLLAGPRAEVDVRPQLEIYTDEVQCSHGATCGKLDEDMLFYLQSRGLEQETAQLLLKWAFLEDVVSRIDLPELRKQIELTLAGQLQGAASLREMLL